MSDTATDTTLPLGSTDASTAPGADDTAAGRGRVLERRGDDVVLFQPRHTSYELHLVSPGLDREVGKSVRAVVRAEARKVYTVPSGGNFVVPIMGTPRIVQGRVLEVRGEHEIVLQAGATVAVTMPADPHAIDLGNGPIEAGAIVNAVLLPGARLEVG